MIFTTPWLLLALAALPLLWWLLRHMLLHRLLH